jgi:ELWxxDGT repeat protein
MPMTGYSYTQIDDSLGVGGTEVTAINDAGEVAGTYIDSSGNQDGFVDDDGTYTTLNFESLNTYPTYVTAINAAGAVAGYVEDNGAYTGPAGYGNDGFIGDPEDLSTFNPGVPGGSGAFVEAINASGEVAGYYSSGGSGSGIVGFVATLGASGSLSFTSIAPPGSVGTLVFAINDAGEVGGSFSDSSSNQVPVQGFIYANGTYTTIDDPLGVKGTAVVAINNTGDVAGFYQDANGIEHGFTYDNGTYTTIDDPFGVGGTYVAAINNAGEVAGYYIDSSGNQNGFVEANGIYTTIDDPSGVGGTMLIAINDGGQVAGDYIGADGNEHGFVATPSPTPVVFVGRDPSNHYNLWVTDGTAASTVELTGVSGANTSGLIEPAYPYSADLTAFNGKVLFSGYDSSFDEGLWVTDGTVAGTYELTGISGANSHGILSGVVQQNPTLYNMVVLNGEVLFAGLDASNHVGLWTTNGTAAGTSELTGITAAANSFDPQDLTVFNGEVLFNGFDSSFKEGLWVTNGTASGTYELTGISGASSFTGMDPYNLTPFNNEVLFEGQGSDGQVGLWVTNGTVPGTYELTGISGANAYGLHPTDLTVFTNEVLFNGVDSNGDGKYGLWVTDGTAAGTYELTGISGAYAAGGIDPQDLTVFGGEVLFEGTDTSGAKGLWVTNGTVSGTYELTGISGTSPSYSFSPTDLTVVNDEVLFNAVDSSGKYGLWVTDGTVSGTHELTGINDVFSGGVDPNDMTAIPCYCRGTLIRTQHGEMRVEKLKIGDEVMTASGALRPIKWIGRRSYGGRFIMGRKNILPICIKAGALGENVPRRDLRISPHHAMYLDGILIEAKDLVNGISIEQAESVEQIEYFHIELESHDVIIAEGALSETFIDDDDRFMFHNANEYRVLYPAAATATIARYCAPRLDEGYEVETIRRHIALRAGLVSEETSTSAGQLRGFVDRVTPHIIEGWAQSVDHPEAPVCLDIYAGAQLIGQVLANRYREDLKQAGMGSGCHSFVFRPPPGIVSATDQVAVCRSLDGAALLLSAQAEPINASIAA